MEKLFARLSQISATTVFLVLIATLVVLYLNAKPAIEAFGAQFLIDPRWGVEVTVDDTGHEVAAETNDQGQAHGVTRLDLGEDEDAIPMDDELGEEGMAMEEDASIPMDSEDEAVPMDDETDVEASGAQTKEIYGGLVPIVGTLFSTILAMLFAVPVAMGIAVFLSELAPQWLGKPVGIAIELLAAIPSIIYGMWGLFFFGPFIADIFGGSSVSLLVAGLVLAIMIVPFMAALSRDAINTTPDVLKESAYAVGATKFEVIKDIVFPYAKAGILGSMIISLGRALGETMAVAFVIGGVFRLPEKLTDPTTSIPVVLANNFAESSGLSLSALYYLAFILFVVSFIVIFAAKHYFLRRVRT